jgi:hypothetical protein
MGWYDVQTSVDSVNTACLGTEYADAEGISQGLPVYSSETLYACWLLTYEVTFDANGGTGTAPDSQSVPGNAAIQNLTTGGATYDAPTLAGYTLQGWYNQNTAVSPATAACNGVQYADAEGNADASKHITAATTLYACWLDQTAPDSVTGVTASIPNEWTNSVRLSIPTSTDNGGTQVDDLQYCVSTSDSITTASPGCRSSLAAGWIIESDEFTVDYTSATPDTAFTIYIYVKDLRSNVSAYTAYTNTVRTMTYEKNGGSAITTPQYFLNGSSLVDASTNTPTLAGATFETWCDFGDASFAECTSFKSDGTGYEFAPGDSFPFDNSGNQPYFYTTDSHVLYALYKFNNPDAASFDIVPATFEDLADGYIDGVTATYEYAEVASSDDCSTVSSWTAGTGEISGISGADVSYYCIRKVADVTNGILASDPIKLEVAAGTARVYDPDVQIEATTELIYGYDDVAYYTVTFDNSASNSPVTFATPTLTGSDFVVVGDCASDSTLVAAGETVSDNCEVHFLAGKNAGTYSTTVTVGWISVAGNGGVPGTSKSDSIAVTGYEQTVAQRPITIKANDVRVFQGTNINDFNELINWTITVGELVEGDSLLGSYKIDVSCVGNTDTIGVKEDCVVEDSEHMFDSEPFAGNYDITVLKGNVVIAAAFTISGDEEKLVVEPDALCYTVGNLWTYNEDELTVHLDEIGKTRVDVNTFVAGTNSAGSCLGTIVGVTFEQTATKVRNVIVESNVFAQGAISSTQGSPDFVAEPADNTLEFVHFDTQLKAVELRSNAFLQVSETGNTLNDVEFGSNIQTISIGDNAFRQYTVDGYNALQELVFADNAKTIVLGDSAFEQYNKANSVALADVTFPQGVVTLGIGDYAFYQYSDNANTALTQITFPDSVAQFKVGHGAFEQRAGDDATLVSVTFPSKLRELEIGSRAFYQHSGYYVNDMHEGNVALKTIVFPPALTKLTIGERAFQQTANSNDELVGVSFPDSLKSLRIDDYAFQQISHTGANALESVTFPINLENLYIGDNAFYQESIKGNNALESVTFPIRVQSLTINDEAFAQVVGDSNAKNSLKYFFIPSEVPPGLGAGYIALGENITRVTNSVTQVSSLIDWTWYGDGGTTTARWGSFVVGGSGVYNLVHQDGPIKLYRLYNPVSLEHFYTTDAYERDTLVQVAPDWTYEHVGWVAPNRGTPVFRLYNPILGDHLYTTDTNERDTLTREYNWIYEKIAFYSGGTIPIYRAFNPHLISGSHLYTSSINEQLDLMSFGWNNEYIKMYSMAEQCPTPDKPNPDIYYCDAIN